MGASKSLPSKRDAKRTKRHQTNDNLRTLQDTSEDIDPVSPLNDDDKREPTPTMRTQTRGQRRTSPKR